MDASPQHNLLAARDSSHSDEQIRGAYIYQQNQFVGESWALALLPARLSRLYHQQPVEIRLQHQRVLAIRFAPESNRLRDS